MLTGLILVGALLSTPQTQAIQWASPTQEAAFQYGPFPQCASGGWGSGKTFAFCLKALWLSDTFPKNRGVIFRRVAKELRATTMATFFKLCPARAYDPSRGGRRNDQDGYLKLAGSGSEILFIHLDNPDIEGIIKGLEINWFFGDQAEENPQEMEEVFDLLLGRLGRWDVATVPQWLLDQESAAGRPWHYFHPESGKPVPPPYAMIACNPDTELHWIYRRFHPESQEHRTPHLAEIGPDRQPTGRLLSYADRGYKLFDMPSDTNKFLSQDNLEYLFAHDDAFVKRNVKGIWGLPEGAIHTVDPLSVLEGDHELLEYFRACCVLHRFLDHGDTSPTCCLWLAIDRDGNLFWYREYYLPNALISTHRANITALSEHERYDVSQADPSIFYRVQKLGSKPSTNNDEHGGRWSVSDEYSDVTNLPASTALHWSPADNNELGTRNRINELLRVDPNRVHPITKARGAPRMFFVKASDRYPQGCQHVLRETRAQRRVKIGTDLGRPVFSDQRDPGITDHAYDPLRYGVASRAPQMIEAQQADPRTFFGAQQRLAEAQRKRMGLRR